MIKLNLYPSIAIALFLAASVSVTGALVASAQMAGTMEPALYNSSGTEVNSGTTQLAAGYYYLAPGAQSDTEVYYNGDGTYVDQTTGLYGGSVSDPNGTAGVSLIYGTKTATPSMGTVAPGVPNTGAGGEAFASWMTLIATGMIAAGGVSYLVTRKGPAIME